MGFTLDGSQLIQLMKILLDYASWTFRKAPKFFDVVTYTGDYVAGRTISHNLGSVPAMIIVKATDISYGWAVYHKDLNGGTNPEDYYIQLNTTAAEVNNSSGAQFWGAAPTSTEFTVGSNPNTNRSGYNYVAYLFAHNDGDGEFGPDADADIIKCGSYTGTGSAGNFIDLGFEPQWLMIKRTDAAASWEMLDIMRGMPTGGEGSYLRANSTNAEATSSNHSVTPSPTGFTIDSTSNINGNGDSFIYIAIRRGPMAVPESATEAYNTILRTGTSATASVTGVGFSPDLIITGARNASRTHALFTRLHGAGKYQISTGATGEYSNTTTLTSFDMDGYSVGSDSGATAINTSDNLVSWNFKRTPNVYDTVVYTGTGSATTVSHNLGIAPELMIIKGTSTSFDRRWIVYTGTANKYMRLNQTDSDITDGTVFNNTSPSATSFTVGTSSNTNASGENYIAHLFGTLSGISKVGSYTGNGSSQNIDCGFTSGARFILIKRSDSAGDWYVWDSSRGITTGNDPHLSLNSTNSEVSTDDSVDPVSSGFAVNQVAATNINVSSASYVFYAVS